MFSSSSDNCGQVCPFSVVRPVTVFSSIFFWPHIWGQIIYLMHQFLPAFLQIQCSLFGVCARVCPVVNISTSKYDSWVVVHFLQQFLHFRFPPGFLTFSVHSSTVIFVYAFLTSQPFFLTSVTYVFAHSYALCWALPSMLISNSSGIIHCKNAGANISVV